MPHCELKGEMLGHTNLSTCSPEDIVLIYEGDRAIGYCWTGVACEGGATSGRKGRIFMLGKERNA